MSNNTFTGEFTIELANVGPQGAPAEISAENFIAGDNVVITDSDSKVKIAASGGGGGGIPGVTQNTIQVDFPRDSDRAIFTGGTGSANVTADSITISSGATLAGTVTVVVNGINFIQNIDYTVSGQTITFPGYDLAFRTGDLIIITG